MTMQPVRLTVKALIQGTKQFEVPHYQRAYSWKKDPQWKKLWEDISQLSKSPEDSGLQTTSHFIGAIVSVYQGESSSGITRYLLIDGQQRLLTLMILLSAIRDLQSDPSVASKFQRKYIANEDEVGTDFFKLIPTEDDRQPFMKIAMGKDSSDISAMKGQIPAAYRYFSAEIKKSGIELEVLERVVTDRLNMVHITLDQDDNPHVIFQSLNGTGSPLTQADLIRNYFFMKIRAEEHSRIYEHIWKPMEDALAEIGESGKRSKKDYLTDFIRHFLMQKGSLVNTQEVYLTLTKDVDYLNGIARSQEDVIAYLERLSRFAQYYRKVLDPQEEKDRDIAIRVDRFNRLEITIIYPFLLALYDALETHRITKEHLLELLDLVMNFVVRRLVCNISSQGLNKVFCKLAGDAIENNFDQEQIKIFLGSKKYPTDRKFVEGIISNELYAGNGRLARVVLECIEESFGHKEIVGISGKQFQVEHVLPQSPSDWWDSHLGANADEQRELHLHVLGNLTLTGLNPELSNKPFPEKKTVFANSHIQMNRYFESCDAWTGEEIKRRGNELATLCASNIWSTFVPETAADESLAHRSKKKSPTKLRVLNQEHQVGSWSNLIPALLETVIFLDPEGFDQVKSKFDRYIRANKGNWAQAKQLSNGMWVTTAWPSERAVSFCQQVIDAVGLGDDDWSIEYKMDADELAAV